MPIAEFFFDVLQLIIGVRLLYLVLRWLVKDKRKSIAYKLWKVATRRLHHKLDAMLKEQETAIKQSPKIVPFKRVR